MWRQEFGLLCDELCPHRAAGPFSGPGLQGKAMLTHQFAACDVSVMPILHLPCARHGANGSDSICPTARRWRNYCYLHLTGEETATEERGNMLESPWRQSWDTGRGPRGWHRSHTHAESPGGLAQAAWLLPDGFLSSNHFLPSLTSVEQVLNPGT